MGCDEDGHRCTFKICIAFHMWISYSNENFGIRVSNINSLRNTFFGWCTRFSISGTTGKKQVVLFMLMLLSSSMRLNRRLSNFTICFLGFLPLSFLRPGAESTSQLNFVIYIIHVFLEIRHI